MATLRDGFYLSTINWQILDDLINEERKKIFETQSANFCDKEKIKCSRNLADHAVETNKMIDNS